MFDTLAVAQQLTVGGVARDQTEVIAKAIHDGLEHGDHVTTDQFKAGLAEVRAEIANLTRGCRRKIAELRTKQRTGIANLETRLRPLDGRHGHRDGDVDRRHPAPAWMTSSKPPAAITGLRSHRVGWGGPAGERDQMVPFSALRRSISWTWTRSRRTSRPRGACATAEFRRESAAGCCNAALLAQKLISRNELPVTSLMRVEHIRYVVLALLRESEVLSAAGAATVKEKCPDRVRSE